jgi:hypothetical protein
VKLQNGVTYVKKQAKKLENKPVKFDMWEEKGLVNFRKLLRRTPSDASMPPRKKYACVCFLQKKVKQLRKMNAFCG